jgi:spore photoproduct lyase
VTTDSSADKWAYREHTRVKHILLEKYLEPWIKILGRRHPRICYVDGFAGRGEYAEGTLGSPLKALRVADGLSDHYRHMLFIFVEKDRDNFDNLQQVLEREKTTIRNLHKMTIDPYNREFADVMREVTDRVLHHGAAPVPSFFFIDPFGFAEIPFDIVRAILAHPRTEVFFTFMVRDMKRFLAHPDLVETFTTLFGTDEWRNLKDLPHREAALTELYRKQLHEVCKVEYSFSFRVSETDKARTLYYLIHATNNFTGHKIMKQIMFNVSPNGSFAYHGPDDLSVRYQGLLFEMHDTERLKDLLVRRLAGRTLKYDDIEKEMSAPWQSEPPYVDRHYREALEDLEEEGRVSVQRVTSKKHGLRGDDAITFPSSNPGQIALPLMEGEPKAGVARPKVYYKEFPLLDGTKELLLWRVGDGSIITRFDKTPAPAAETDVVCPHFVELKWAYGCPFDCAWCYLKGTFRFRPGGPSPVVKPFDKTELHVQAFLEEVKTPEILNTGEIADSLMSESTEHPFSKFIIPLFERQKLHKVLFLTKSSNVENLVEIWPHTHAVISFSLNAVPVADRWEKAPNVQKRIRAAKEVFDAGYEVRVRIDPIVPVDNWAQYYCELLNMIFDAFTPERVTLGSLRGLQSTINGCSDKTWVKYLRESSNWGRKTDLKTRLAMYSLLTEELAARHDFHRVALCKETVEVWDALAMDYTQMRCNCIA